MDWDWAAPAFQAYSTASDLAKVCTDTGVYRTEKVLAHVFYYTSLQRAR